VSVLALGAEEVPGTFGDCRSDTCGISTMPVGSQVPGTYSLPQTPGALQPMISLTTGRHPCIMASSSPKRSEQGLWIRVQKRGPRLPGIELWKSWSHHQSEHEKPVPIHLGEWVNRFVVLGRSDPRIAQTAEGRAECKRDRALTSTGTNGWHRSRKVEQHARGRESAQAMGGPSWGSILASSLGRRRVPGSTIARR
jgi:hypothetical protein